MKLSYRYFGFLLVIGLLPGLLANPSAGMTLPAHQQSPSSGAKLFVQGHSCHACHAVKAAHIRALAQTKGIRGPDLTGFQSNGRAAAIASYLRGEGELRGESHLMEFQGSQTELLEILEWLSSLPNVKSSGLPY